MRELGTIQEKILDRALFLIGKRGNYDVPIRDITREAGVNVNAINYYFGNKEQLIDQVEEFFIRNHLSVYSVLDQDMNNEEKLLSWANEVMEYTIQYPGIQAILHHNLKSERNGIMQRFLKGEGHLLDKKVDQLLKAVMGIDDEEIYFTRILFNSAVLYPAIFGTDFEYDMTKINDRDFRIRYLAFVINKLKKGTVQDEI